jgi:glyoxylase-like metal-dependent hydrolase (beta-lactamase superfamily II)
MLQIHSAVFNPFSENTYVIYNDMGQCWIVDPGMYGPDEVKQLQDFIEGKGLKPQAIINTHTHIDHIFGVQALMDAYDIPFYADKREAPVLANAVGSAMMFGLSFKTAPVVTEYLNLEQPLMLGDDQIEIRLAPGHSPGSVVFYYSKGGWAIGGDVLFSGSIGRSDLPGGDMDTLLASIRTQLYTLPDGTIIYPGHGPETTIEEEKRSNPFVRG